LEILAKHRTPAFRLFSGRLVLNIASSNDASVGTDSAGIRYRGRMIAAMEKPLATKTLIAVASKAGRIAFIVVIDSSLRVRL
jgi:hypothetical protein